MLGGRAQAALVEQRSEAERLQRDGLAAGVRAADHERAQRAELEVDRHRRRRVEQRMAGAAQDDGVAAIVDRACPASGARARRTASARSICATRLDERGERLPRARRPPRERAQDALDLLALGALRLAEPVRLARPTANGSTKSVCPAPELSWTMPGTAPRADARRASTGRPPRSVTKSSCRCSRTAGSRAKARRRSARRARPPRSSRRRRRRAGEAPSRRSEPSSSTAARAPSRAALERRRRSPPRWPRATGRSVERLERRPARRAPSRSSGRSPTGSPGRGRCRAPPSAAASRDVGDVREVGLGGLLEQRDRLAREGLPARHLVDVVRRGERAAPAPRPRLARRRDPRAARGSPGARAARARAAPSPESRPAASGHASARTSAADEGGCDRGHRDDDEQRRPEDDRHDGCGDARRPCVDARACGPSRRSRRRRAPRAGSARAAPRPRRAAAAAVARRSPPARAP